MASTCWHLPAPSTNFLDTLIYERKVQFCTSPQKVSELWVCSGWARCDSPCSKCPAVIPAHACHQYFKIALEIILRVVKVQRVVRWWIFDGGLSYMTVKLRRDNMRLKITWIMKIRLFVSLNFDFGGHTQLSYKSRACVAFTEVGLTRAGCGSSGFCREGWKSPKPTNTYCCTYGTRTKSGFALCCGNTCSHPGVQPWPLSRLGQPRWPTLMLNQTGGGYFDNIHQYRQYLARRSYL